MGVSELTIDRRLLLKAIGGAAAAASLGGTAIAGPKRYAATQALLDAYVASGKVPGAIVGFVTPGAYRPIWLSAGTARFDGGPAITPDSIWRLFSMTKPITGVAVMQQIADGKLTLDTPLADILPEFRKMRVLIDPARSLESKPAEKPILVRHLLTHAAGFTYTIAGDGPLEREYRRQGLAPSSSSMLSIPGDPPAPDLTTYMQRLAALPLRTEPGTALQYSVALDVAGALLERLTGETLDKIFARQLFAPLGMKDSGFWLDAPKTERLVSLYSSFDPATRQPLAKPMLLDSPENSAWSKRPAMLAGGAGLVASAENYARFAQMMLNEGEFGGRVILPRHVARLAMSNQLASGLFFPPYQGLASGGIVTLADKSSEPDGANADVWGWAGAGSTLVQIDPIRRRAVIVMLQTMGLINSPLDPVVMRAINADR